MDTKSLEYLFVCVAAIAALPGCRSPYYADRGAALGGVTGAIAGAAIGQNNGEALPGAVIGSAVGALTGAVIGDSIDADIARNNAMVAQAVGRLPGAVTPNDVIAMTQAGLSEEVIITHIRGNGVAFVPQVNDLINLQKSGVSPAVIQAMQRPPAPVVVPVANRPRPVIIEEYYYDPLPPPCPPVRWHHHHHHAHGPPRPWMHWGFSFHHH